MNSSQDSVVNSKSEALFCSDGIAVTGKIEKKKMKKHGHIQNKVNIFMY